MSKNTSNQVEVLFWEQMDGQIVVQKNNDFLTMPKQATEQVKTNKSMRRDIAARFDSAPFKTKGFNVMGARVFDRIPC